MSATVPRVLPQIRRSCSPWCLHGSLEKQRTRRRAAALGVIILSMVFTLACTGSPPEILETKWEVRLEQDRDSGLVFQTLSLFVKPNDPDGNEDLEEMYVIHDAEELFWRLDPDSWVQTGSGAELWIGSNNFRLPDGMRLPNGEYRILLRDVAGEAAETSIRVHAPSLSEAREYLPEVSVSADMIRLKPRDREYTLWLYGLDGTYVAAVPVRQGLQSLGSLRASYPATQSGFRFRVYARVDALNLGVVAGLYTVEPQADDAGP